MTEGEMFKSVMVNIVAATTIEREREREERV